MLRFAKQGIKSGRELKNTDVYDSKNLLEHIDMEIGADTEKTLSVLDFGQRKTQLHGIRKFYQAVASYLQTRLPLNDDVIGFIQSSFRSARAGEGTKAAQRVMNIPAHN